ncbi:putative gluconokinase [Arapaima gigas]
MILVVMGVSGSGKACHLTCLSLQLGWRLHEGDDHHPWENIEKMARGEPLTDQDRIPWLLQLHGIIQREISAGANAIVTCSALKRAYRQMLLFGETPRPCGGSPPAREGVWFAFLHGPFRLIQERLVARKGHYMSADLLQSQFDALEPPADAENAFTVDIQRSVPEMASDIERAISTVGLGEGWNTYTWSSPHKALRGPPAEIQP